MHLSILNWVRDLWLTDRLGNHPRSGDLVESLHPHLWLRVICGCGLAAVRPIQWPAWLAARKPVAVMPVTTGTQATGLHFREDDKAE